MDPVEVVFPCYVCDNPGVGLNEHDEFACAAHGGVAPTRWADPDAGARLAAMTDADAVGFVTATTEAEKSDADRLRVMCEEIARLDAETNRLLARRAAIHRRIV